MSPVNPKRVLVAGLAAGLVMNVIDFAANTFVTGGRMQAELTAVNPQLWSNLNMPAKMPVFFIIDFVLGILLVWLYAAMRPRFGPGPRTAITAALFVWLISGTLGYIYVLMGLFSTANFAMNSAVGLINFAASAWVGGKLYAEPAAPEAPPA